MRIYKYVRTLNIKSLLKEKLILFKAFPVTCIFCLQFIIFNSFNFSTEKSNTYTTVPLARIDMDRIDFISVFTERIALLETQQQ